MSGQLHSNDLIKKSAYPENAAVNRSIGGQTPEEYVTHWRIKLGRDKLDNCNFDSILRSHAINPEILATKECKNKWDDFVVDRRERLRQLIESACGGVFQSFDDSE